MRSPYSLCLAVIMILAAGCSPRGGVAVASPAASTQAATDAVQVGKQLLESADWRWLDAPKPVLVRQMSYQEAHTWIQALSQDDRTWGAQTSVWLVVFEGRWGSSDPAQANAQSVVYEGCLWVLFRATDGKLIATGSTLCPRGQ